MDKVPQVPGDISKRLRVLDVLEQLSQINLARDDMEDALHDMLEFMLEVFRADRAWFLYPCNPDAPFWSVPMECSRPEWPGLFAQGVDMPMNTELSETFRELLRSNGPIQQNLVSDPPVPRTVADHFLVKSQLLTMMRPKIGDPWVFGLHHCETQEIHDKDDIDLFTAISQRISDFLNIWISIRKLRESEERWKFALEGAGDGVWDWNPQTDKASFSRRWKEMIGYAEDEFPDNGTAWAEHLHPDDRDRVLSTIREYFSGNLPSYAIEFRMRCKDGSWKWILARGKLISRDADGNPLRIIGTHSDISDQKQAEQLLHIAATAFEVHEGIMITDVNSVILRVNRAFTNITGYTAPEVLGKNPRILSSGRQDNNFYVGMWDDIKHSGGWAGEIWNRRKNGEIFPEHLTITAVKDAKGIVTNYVAIYTDFTMSKSAEAQIKNMAFYDHLTQLPNRRLFFDRFSAALSASERHGDYGATMLIDLDRFKILNDMHGHGYGDLLLKEVAVRIKSCIREMDTVARFGGDEFVVLIEAISKDRSDATAKVALVAEKIRERLAQPYMLKELEYQSSSSIGISLFHSNDDLVDSLIEYADRAMYQAKTSGRNAIRFFEPGMQHYPVD